VPVYFNEPISML
jgi:hypothetical protein